MSPLPDRDGGTTPPHRPLRVVHVTLGLDVGGQEKLLIEFARHRDRSRVEMHVVSLTTRGPLTADIEACDVPVTALNAPQGLRPDLIPRLAWLFGNLRADVIHTHDDRPNIYGAPAGRMAGVRKILHTRHNQGTRLSPRQTALVRLVSMCDDHFVCISHDSAAWAIRKGISRNKVSVVHNGIDLNRFAFTGPDPTGPVVLVARLSPEKGVEYLLEAVTRILPQQGDFQLLIAGDGPSRASLEERSRMFGLKGVVQFLGNVQDVPGLLKKARLFVLPSLTEGISLTLLEAMARGLPVVTTRVGGNPEVTAHEETGLLVPAQDPDQLANSMLRLWRSAESCSRMGKAGRQRVEQLFDIRRMVANYEAMYFT